MTSSATAENNCLKDIIGEIIVSYSEEPYETFIVSNDALINQVIETEHTYEIFNITTGFRHYIQKKNVHIEFHTERIDVFKKKYFCTLTQSFINSYALCYLSNVEMVSKYKYLNRPSFYGEQFNAQFISTSRNSFVFNIVDIRKNILAFLMSMNARQSLEKSFLAPEVIESCILPYFDCDKRTTYLQREFKGVLPKYMSMEQVKRLYELGMIKMIMRVSDPITMGSQHERFGILSDDAFDNDSEGAIKKIFKTKEHMHGYIERELKRLFL